uniref:DUF4806 domain-containing protein n=1 Tax=Schizaphis graminum TaxID=13262 RepID=A0A2S2PHG5_SCHGA
MWISRWPKTGNISKMISEHAEYGNDWPTYPVKIVSQYYDNYKEATTKERQIFISASASESEHTVRVIPKSPVLQKKRTYYKTFQDDSDSSISSATLTPIKVKKSVQDKPATETVLDDETVVSRPFNTSRSNYFQTDNEMFQSITSALNCVNGILEEPITETLSLETNSHVMPLNKMQNEQNHQNIVEQIATILAYVKRIDKKLESLMEDSVSLNKNNDNSIVSLFPITSVEALQNIETKLLDATFEKQMINFVTQIGGLNAVNFTKRVFARVFTNQLATQYSWTGFRNNNPLKQLQLIAIIKDVCLRTFTVTDMEFESNVKNWFKNGSLRLSREKK